MAGSIGTAPASGIMGDGLGDVAPLSRIGNAGLVGMASGVAGADRAGVSVGVGWLVAGWSGGSGSISGLGAIVPVPAGATGGCMVAHFAWFSISSGTVTNL